MKKIAEKKHARELMDLKISMGRVAKAVEEEMKNERVGLVKGRYEAQKDLREYIQRLGRVFDIIKQVNRCDIKNDFCIVLNAVSNPYK